MFRWLVVAATVLLLILVSPHRAFAQPRVWIADQGNNQTVNNPNNRILEIDPFNLKVPPDPDGTNVIILNTVPSPAGAFLDELTFDDNDRLWCVVKDDNDQDPDGARRIDKETGLIDVPPGLITIDFAGQAFGGFLEGLAWDGTGLWTTAVREGLAGNMLTRVDPATGNQIAPFDGATPFVNIPGNIAQGAVWEPGNGGYGWLWHSDVGIRHIYKLDISLLFDGDPGNDGNLVVADFEVPFPPKGMDWMEDKIWVASPHNGIWEFDPVSGATQKLFHTPNWNLDGLAILPQPPGPRIELSTDTITTSVWIYSGNPADEVFTIRNAGEGTLEYDIDDDETAPWLTVSPVTGTSTGEEDDITISFTVDGFKAGSYEATLTVTGNAYNSPQTVNITVTVETVGPDLDGDGDVDMEDHALIQKCLGPGGQPPAAGCENADIDGDHDVDQEDENRFRNCVSGANVLAAPGCDS